MPTIMLIRHAEKPLGDGPPLGVDADGNQDRESLTPRGWQRAGALVGLFTRDPASSSRSPVLLTPTHLFASLVAAGSSSRRPRETLDPLAARLGLAIDTRFPKSGVSELARAALATDGVPLIAWEHHLIPSLATAILGQREGIPSMWPDDRYDVIWIFEPSAEGGDYTFRQATQLLLAGDRAEVIAPGG